MNFFDQMQEEAPQLVALFLEKYDPPKLLAGVCVGTKYCSKCGIVEPQWKIHLEWHKELSLRLFSNMLLTHDLAVATGFIEEPQT